ncbi:hypothetical protein GLOTRDRAFT_91339 [Gloeophyllum trabeum ATCC 11539]|uniref:Uncharacterized protein n=1 Tax=Gloeophyllum trabeum (strain ATCC 11539 / FP-39264 / Madison 617) TaxID=670483 RepID=S7S284_GLOTA|nr:uncharacterized protein GLOTRDRAFT_91339 [Gloeophyllum trabeum ATCC 11539]EPQ59884.1 hypothetical protein GLOTRDRAFT_91339 [Gloeophyllum trabeum ATCC 11539]
MAKKKLNAPTKSAAKAAKKAKAAQKVEKKEKKKQGKSKEEAEDSDQDLESILDKIARLIEHRTPSSAEAVSGLAVQLARLRYERRRGVAGTCGVHGRWLVGDVERDGEQAQVVTSLGRRSRHALEAVASDWAPDSAESDGSHWKVLSVSSVGRTREGGL